MALKQPPNSAEQEVLPPASEQRVVRWFMGLGMVITAGFATLLLLGADGGNAMQHRISAAACLALSTMFGVLAWRPATFTLARTMTIALAAVAVTSATVAVTSGAGVSLLGLAFVPLLLCAAASLLRPQLIVAIGVAHGLILVALALAQGLGRLGPPLAAIDLAFEFGSQVALLAAGIAVGLLMRQAIRRTVAALHLREQRFVGLLAVAADWYWETDRALRFTALTAQNDAAAAWVPARHLGLTPWEIEDFGLDGDAMDALRADMESHQPFSDLLLRRRDEAGRTRWLMIGGRPRFDARGVLLGYWGMGRDVTTEREAELNRQASEGRYRELFARSPTPLVLHRDGLVLDANVAALSLFGAWTPEDLIGRALLPFYDEAGGSRATAARRSEWLSRLPVGESTTPQGFSLRTTAGRLLSVQVGSVKVEADGGEAILSIYRDETERLRTERARERSEKLLAHVVATSPDLITLTEMASGRYVMVNDAFVALSGWTREDAIGRTSAEMGIWREGDRDRFVALLRERGACRDVPMTFRDRFGRDLSLLVSAARFAMEGRDYVVINARDVTQNERERLEREAILTNASIGIALTRDRRFTLANPKFEQMFGWPAGAMVGQAGDITSVDAAAYAELGQLVGPALARGEAVEFERTMKRRDGSIFLARLLARPIDLQHPAQGATIWIAEDVTEQRAVQQALARARDQAEAANRAKSAFLANTSHEIRTPLNGLVGLARLARQSGLAEARRTQYLAQIDDSAQALSGVISDILDLSKIEAGKLALEQTDFDLHALLESIEHGYSAIAEARSLQLVLHVEAGVPRRVRGDALRVRQILSNYLNNALKFTERGIVRIHVAAEADEHIRFEVEDSGPGITPAVQARLFEPFTQADDSTTRRYGGTGLGLSICRQLAQLMGGSVGLSSQPDQGSRFWALLPLPASREDAPASAFGALDAATSPLAGCSLLIVEDNPVNMMIVVALLEQWGVKVAQSSDGADAVARVHARADTGEPFDLVLMDVQMPVQGGHEATRQLRRRFGADELPIVALTAAALTSERDEALAAGMNDFLTKPIDAQRLHETLLRWTTRRATAAH